MILIMDGYGMNDNSYGNAIAQAKKPNLNAIFKRYPNTRIHACGEYVGLPEGQMGNSEVGHMNIGAGRIVYQDLSKITRAIGDGSFSKNPAIIKAIENVKKNNSTLHILGLLSDGGVHSHIDHLFAILDIAKSNALQRIMIHPFTDGRDVAPRCAMKYIEALEKKLTDMGIGQIATIGGRYYGMDRDKRWERLQLAYDAMAMGKGEKAETAASAVKSSYARGNDDEFIIPTVINDALPVSNNDSLIMFNFRADRAREISRAFTDPEFDGFVRAKFPENIIYVCMTEYDAELENIDIAFPPDIHVNTLGEYISKLGMKQLRIAETEKYAHVTFFFNGGVEKPHVGEDRIMIPSPKVATYDLQPEMSAPEVTDKVIEKIMTDNYDVIILNYANADMVGHTGNMNAAIKAIETLDNCVARVADAVLDHGGQILLTADHGNADVMLDGEGKTVTAHSLNQVPLVHIAEDPAELKNGGKLADLAPTMLALMGIDIPDEMAGNVLIK